MHNVASKRIVGFTLAELLVALTTIGIIAALVIPVFVRNFQLEIYKQKWRRTFSSFSQVTNQLVFENGGSLVGAFNSMDEFRDKYLAKMSYIKKCDSWSMECWNEVSWELTAILADGTFIKFIYHDLPDCSYTYLENIPVPICADIQVDVNGFKGPNIYGVDIFSMMVRKNAVVPFGASGTAYSSQDGCVTGNDIRMCSMEYLKQ